jgi:Cys-rich protein (TIGR01571 family)
MPPPSKALTRQGTTQIVIGEIPAAPPQATVVSEHTSSASSLPPSRPFQTEQPPPKAWSIKESIKSAKKAMSHHSKQATPAASTQAIHEHTPSSSSDWEQPMPQRQQVATTSEPKVKAERYEEGNLWEHSILGCFGNPGACCLGFCLPCVLYSKTDHRLKVDPSLQHWKGCDGPCVLSCCVISCLSPIGAGILAFIQRRELQDRYKLKKDTLTDIAFSFILPCCTMVQTHNESKDLIELQNTGNKEQYSNGNARMTYARGGTSSSSSSDVRSVRV